MEDINLIPILYNSTETQFNNNGIGALKETLSCHIFEERNGVFELELEYPVSGYWLKEIKDLRIILAKPNDYDEPHGFRIYDIEKNEEEKTVIVYAASATNDLGGNIVVEATASNVNAQTAMNNLKSNLLYPTHYNFVSDIQTKSSSEWKYTNPLNCIVGSAGSMVSLWGGELKRTNSTIFLYSRRGSDNVAVIKPGKGLQGFKQNVSTKGLTTAILPYATYYFNNEEITVRAPVVESPLVNNYPVKYTEVVDFSDTKNIFPARESDSEGNETISAEDYKGMVIDNLITESNRYFTYKNPGVDKPKVTIEVDILQLSDSSEYEALRALSHIGLTDTVNVWVEKFDVDVTVVINKVQYDSLGEKVLKFTAGTKKKTLYEDVRKDYQEQIDQVKVYVGNVENGIYNTIRETADGKNNIFSGYTRPDDSIVKFDDIWYKPLGSGEIEMYRWDGVEWQIAVQNADKLTLGTIDARKVNLIYLNASNISTGEIIGANGRWDLDSGFFQLGDADSGSSLTWDGTQLLINMSTGETLEEYIGDVSQAVTNLDGYVNNAFRDGVISEAEAKAIEKYLNIVNTEKADVDAKYTKLYANALLAGAAKTDLLAKKNLYNTAHTNLISAINSAISDGKTNTTEKANVDSKFTAYKTALTNLSSAFETASAYLVSAVNGRFDGPTGVLTRLTNAESKITDTAIISTVSEKTTSDGKPLFAKTSEVKQTVDNWTAKFSQIGGTNFLRNSSFEEHLDNLDTIGVSIVNKNGYRCGRITGSFGSTFYVRWDTTGMFEPNQEYTMSGWVMAENITKGSTNYTIRFYNDGVASGEWLGVGTHEINVTKTGWQYVSFTFKTPSKVTKASELNTWVYARDFTGNLYFRGIQLEKGSVATDWSPHPAEIYTGITEIDKDGAKFGRVGENVETNIGFDGLRIKDENNEIASFTAAGSVIDNIQAKSISGDVMNVLQSVKRYTIGSGKDFDTVSAALEALQNGGKNFKFFDNNRSVTFEIYGTIQDDIVLYNFIGGYMVFDFQPNSRLIGSIYAVGCSTRIIIHGKSDAQRATIKRNINPILFEAYGCTSINARYFDFDNSGQGGTRPFSLNHGTNAQIRDCDFGKTQFGILSYTGSVIQSINNRGSCTSNGLFVSGGLILARGTQANGGGAGGYALNEGHIITHGTINVLESAFTPPATVDRTFTNVFKPSSIYTYSVRYGAPSTHYGASAAQNRWNNTMTQMKGRIGFGSNVYSYISDRKSGTTPTVQMRLRRKNSTHGASASVAPTPEWTGAPNFGGATRGNWTPWVTIPYTLIGSSGYTFSFYDGSTGNKYAIWDSAEIKVTKIKNV